VRSVRAGLPACLNSPLPSLEISTLVPRPFDDVAVPPTYRLPLSSLSKGALTAAWGGRKKTGVSYKRLRRRGAKTEPGLPPSPSPFVAGTAPASLRDAERMSRPAATTVAAPYQQQHRQQRQGRNLVRITRRYGTPWSARAGCGLEKQDRHLVGCWGKVMLWPFPDYWLNDSSRGTCSRTLQDW